MTPSGPSRPTLHRRWLVLFVSALAFVVAVLIGLQAWNDSVFDPGSSIQASAGTYQLIEAIEVAAILFLFWTAVRAGRETGWLFPTLFAAGAALYLYRVVVLSGLFPAGATYTTARAYFPNVVWFPLQLLFWFFGMGVWGLVDRTRARGVAERVARLGMPIAALTAFLLLHLALRSYTRWTGRMGLNFDMLWPSALGLNSVLRPILLVGAFYFLNAMPGVPRRRAFEWFLAGALVALALIVPLHGYSSLPGAWVPDAAVHVSVVGLAAWLLPASRSRRIAHAEQAE